MIMVYCIFNLFILLSCEDLDQTTRKIKNPVYSLEKTLFDMTYTNQLISFETYQLKMHLPDKLFTDCRME